MGAAQRIYASLPVAAQNAAISLYGLYWKQLRFGGAFGKHLQAFRQRERFDAAQWRDWRQTRMRQLLKTAAERVPYFRDCWSAAQKRAACAGRVEELPLLDKQFVRRQPLEFARDDRQFDAMLSAMWRVLKPGGLLFCRLASSIGLEGARPLGDNRYRLPDGSERYLVSAERLIARTRALGGRLLDPLKTTVVQDQRSMTTWVVGK